MGISNEAIDFLRKHDFVNSGPKEVTTQLI